VADPVATFLDRAGWGGAARHALAGDASGRRYERLANDRGRTAVLMDTPPGDGVTAFLAVGRWLRAGGLHPPAVLADDAAAGLLLLEDLGDTLFARLDPGDPDGLHRAYGAAVDVLIHLGACTPPGWMTPMTPDRMADMTDPAFRWYRLDPGGPAPATADLRAALARQFALAGPCAVVALRDYHADNLVWREADSGLRRVGLLDFQDALSAPAGYDLVSLLRDARRDVTPALASQMVDRFATGTGAEPDDLRRRLAVLGVQRNLRILGVFARLSLHAGRPGYVDLIPRVWRHLLADLAHPVWDGLRDRLLAALPPPTPQHLLELRRPCPTTDRP